MVTCENSGTKGAREAFWRVEARGKGSCAGLSVGAGESNEANLRQNSKGYSASEAVSKTHDPSERQSLKGRC